MSVRISIEAVDERAHLDDSARLDRGLPPQKNDIVYLLDHIKETRKQIAEALGLDPSPAEIQLAKEGRE